MIDTDRYDNEGIELSDGGTICFPEDDGRIQRIDKDGNIMQTLHPEDTEWQEWYELFDTHKDLLTEVKRLRIIETAAQLYGDYCQERHGQSYDCDMSFEEWLDWMLTDDILEKMMIHYDKEALDDMKSKATGTGWLLDGCLTDYSKLKGLVE